jgi:hypothetical protein
LAGRLAGLLAPLAPPPDSPLAQSHSFLDAAAQAAGPLSLPWGVAQADEPLDRLARGWKLSPTELDLLLLAGMPEEHEGFASVFRTLHPRGESRPTVGLAAQLLASGAAARQAFPELLETATVARQGALRVSGDTPYFDRSLQLAEALWPALHGVDAWPAGLPRWEARPVVEGLEEWLAAAGPARAVRALQRRVACTILVTADSEEVAFLRALALAVAAGRRPAGFVLPAAVDPELLRVIRGHALARDAALVLRLAPGEAAAAPEAPSFADHPDTVVLCARTGAAAVRGLRPMIAVLADRLSPAARRRMWSRSLPDLAASSALLAARYPLEPYLAAEIAADLGCTRDLDQRALATEDVAEAIRARAALALSGGVKLIRPQAAWQTLVLSRDREQQLREAVARLDQQATVLDEWGFLRGRAGARGVRMLFSGPPGTGKTLSAEVVAGALSVDLLSVDISRVVSKWIGETEKNLSAVFDAAERAQAVLFFDEADALFGRRTEVADAHDRYANLETAYLLARLERFEGLAILATNLRQNIDPAFLRRLEFVVDFDEPDREQRYRLWRCHIPNEELLDPDVNLYELAAHYPVVGGLIRNASVAAAFLAAADGARISQIHFLRAVRREYEKAGKAFPGVPAGVGAI